MDKKENGKFLEFLYQHFDDCHTDDNGLMRIHAGHMGQYKNTPPSQLKSFISYIKQLKGIKVKTKLNDLDDTIMNRYLTRDEMKGWHDYYHEVFENWRYSIYYNEMKDYIRNIYEYLEFANKEEHKELFNDYKIWLSDNSLDQALRHIYNSYKDDDGTMY